MKLLKFSTAVLCYFPLTTALFEEQHVLYRCPERETMNVAVIGAGAGGASAAYHLSKFAANRIPVNITVFERNDYIGGRSTTVNVYDDPSLPVELGASIFVEVNAILQNATKAFNLSTSAFVANADIPGAALSVWDGNEFVITQHGDNSWWDIAKLLWKYGFAPIKTMRLVKHVVGNFLKMYDEPAFPFRSLTQVAQDVGLLAVHAATGEQYLEENAITGDFARHIVQAATRVNYAQNIHYIHGLTTMVSMAAENAVSVQGGNWQIFDKMISAANATTRLGTAVTAVEKAKSGGYELNFKKFDALSETKSHSQSFDVVVMAGPYQFSNTSLDSKVLPDEIPYVQLHVTLFASPHLLSPKFFNLKPDEPAPRVILSTLPKREKPRTGADGVGSPGFFSISLLKPVTNSKTGRQEYVYKIFSASPPSSKYLARLLGLKDRSGSGEVENSDRDMPWIFRKVWHSYPYAYPRVTFEPMQLDDDLWYTSGMDSFISTMETNALMGMNVARLIVDDWSLNCKQAPSQGGMTEETLLVETGPM